MANSGFFDFSTGVWLLSVVEIGKEAAEPLQMRCKEKRSP
jgi:hypothetical protein